MDSAVGKKDKSSVATLLQKHTQKRVKNMIHKIHVDSYKKTIIFPE